MNFILPHSFELDLRRECHYLVHRSFSFRVIQIRRSVQKLSSLGSPSADLFEREGFYFTDCSVIRFIDAQERLLLLCFLYGGNIPFVVSLCFASQRTPTVCAYCAGSISTIGLRSFLLKVSGVSSHLSFCCTSLVSDFIIQEDAQFVYSQSAQQIRHTFASKVQISGIHEFRLSGALLHLPGQRLCPADRAGPSQTLLRHVK